MSLDTIDDDEQHAIIKFNGKDSILILVLKNGRYDLQNGYYIFIKSIIKKPEEFVILDIKRKNQ